MALTCKIRQLVAVLSIGVLSGCVSNQQWLDEQNRIADGGWNAKIPDLQAASLEQMKDWWGNWKDDDLNLLIERAVKTNTDVLTATANVRAAAALADLATADLFPTLSAQGQVTGRRVDGESSESATAGVEAGWALSLVGGNVAKQRAARLEAMASAMTLEDVRISVAGEVAASYIGLRLAQVKRRIAVESLANYTEAAEIARWRYEAGLADKSEIDQAVSNREAARAQIPVLERSVDQYINALARLSSCNAAEIVLHGDVQVPVAPDALAISLPAQTLMQRPDMRASFYTLQATSDRVYVARSQWFPALRLTGSLGTQAATIGALGASGTGVAALIGALSMPILNWGEQVSASEQSLANLDKARASYTATLLKALEETENALSAITSAQRRRPALAAAELAAKSAAELALQQYRAGITDYQTVLNTQRTLLTAQENSQSNAADLATELVALYRALGGGWQPQPSLESQG